MTPRDPKRDCEIVLKILSSMELSKPIALVTICQNTGIKLVDVIHYMEPLESSEIIERTMDNGLIFYILKTENYESTVEHIFMPVEEPAPKPAPSISSREAILKRRSMRQANDSARTTSYRPMGTPVHLGTECSDRNQPTG